VTSGKASPPPGGDAEDTRAGPAPPGEAGEGTEAPAAKPAHDREDDAGGDDARVAGATQAGDAVATEAGGAGREAGEADADRDDRSDDGAETGETGATDVEAADGGEAATEAEDDRRQDDGSEPNAADAVLQAAAEALEVDLELLLAEREQYLDAYRRAQADFENYRKQAQKRQDDAVVRSLGSFVEGLLPVLDSCDAALAHGASEVEPVLSALYGALAKEGLERIDPKGSAFDPAEAEAVVHEPGEGGEQVVAEVLRPGYRWRGRVLRPAMVKVTD
jgi:molecular chaperone GrpE